MITLAKRPAKLIVIPIATFAAVLLAVLLLVNLLNLQSQRKAMQGLEMLSQETATRFESFVATRFNILIILDRYINVAQPNSNQEFSNHVRILTESFPDFRGALLLSDEGSATAGFPESFFQIFSQKTMATDSQGSQLLYQAELTKRLVISKRPMLIDSANMLGAFLACKDRAGRVKGYIFGTFDLDVMLTEFQSTAAPVKVHLRNGETPIWEPSEITDWISLSPREVKVANHIWALQVQVPPFEDPASWTLRWLLYGSLISALVSALVFLTLLKQFAHEQSKRRLSVLISNLPGMAYRLENQEDWTLAFASRGCLELTGYHPEQITGPQPISFDRIVDPRDKENVRKTVKKAVEAHRTYRITYRIVTADGHERWVWESGCGIYNDADQLEAIEGFICDISDRVRAEAELRKHRDQLELIVKERTEDLANNNQQLEKEIKQRIHTEGQLKVLLKDLEGVNHELEAFARVTSHDLKAPLRGMRDLIKWLLEDLGERLSPKEREAFDQLDQRVKRLKLLIDGILRYSSVGTARPKLQIINTATILEDVIRALHPDPSYQIEIASGLPKITYDPTQFHQVLQNLIGNALQHTAPSGGKIRIQYKEEASFWQFSVTDNGKGIDPEHFDRIFEIFSRIGSKPDQTCGIGLAIVKKIVEQNAGEVSVLSEPGRGATFLFTVPKQRETTEQLKREHILVCDHNGDFARITAKVLEREGHFAATATNSAETIEYLKRHHLEVDVVLLDAEYNPEHSMQLHGVIRQTYPNLRIIACIGADNCEAPRDSLNKAFDGILCKPFELEELFEILKNKPN
jgi:PAS domain S-box-containing protein